MYTGQERDFRLPSLPHMFLPRQFGRSSSTAKAVGISIIGEKPKILEALGAALEMGAWLTP